MSCPAQNMKLSSYDKPSQAQIGDIQIEISVRELSKPYPKFPAHQIQFLRAYTDKNSAVDFGFLISLSFKTLLGIKSKFCTKNRP